MLRRKLMLKIRLMGTKNEIEWFEKIMQEHPDIEILKKSELYQNNREADECYRSYAEVKEK